MKTPSPNSRSVSAGSRLCLLALVNTLLLLSIGGHGVQAQSVLLGLQPLQVSYPDLESFGRRILLRVRYQTGITILETCSDVDPEHVVLTVTLPADTTFVAESDGRGVFDPLTGEVSWALGTLDAATYCYGSQIDLTFDVHSSVPGGTMLQVPATIATTSAGDDPADNEQEIGLQAGMLPLEVFFDVDSVCSSGSDSASGQGEALACSDSEPGILPTEASAQVGATGPPRKLGELGEAGGILVAPTVAVAARAYGGFDCESSLTACWDLSISAEATILSSVELVNPNPFEVPLHFHLDGYSHAACSDNDAGFPGDAYVEDVLPSVDCGSSYTNRFPYAERHLDCDGLGGNCQDDVIVTTNGHTESHETFSSSLPRVPSLGTRTLDVIFGSGSAGGDSNVYYGPDWILIRSGYGRYSANARLEIALDDGSLAGTGGTVLLRFVAASPVDLLVSDDQGRRIGIDPDAVAPAPTGSVTGDLATRTVGDLPGARYSGPASEPEEIAIGLPAPGTYGLTVYGTGVGPFTITVESRDAGGNLLDQEVFTGNATEDLVYTEAVTLNPDGTLALSGIFADGFESGSTTAWSATLP